MKKPGGKYVQIWDHRRQLCIQDTRCLESNPSASCWVEPLLHRPCWATISATLQQLRVKLQIFLAVEGWCLPGNILWGNCLCMTLFFGIAALLFELLGVKWYQNSSNKQCSWQPTLSICLELAHPLGNRTWNKDHSHNQKIPDIESTRPCVLYLTEKKHMQRSWQLYETKLFHSEGQACMAQLHGSQLYSHKHKAHPASIKMKRR